MGLDVAGVDVAGVDVALTPAGPVLLEINPSPGLVGVQSVSSVDIAMADRLLH